MKAHLSLLLVILLLASVPVTAQLLAGEVPDGGNAIELDATITLDQAFTADSIALEFDCDDFQDAWVMLYRGAPEVDGPNSAMLRFLDDDVEVCMSLTSPSEQRPKYHAFGEPLDCAGNFDWQISNELVLGDFGGFFTTGPFSIDSLYVGFRRDAQTGWMLLSFGLQAVNLTAHRLLPLCPGPTSVDEATTTSGITLYPNPGNGEHIRVETAVVLRSLEVLDATGRMMALYDGTLRTIPSPSDPGTYLVHATQGDGQRSTKRWVRY
jgi:hypothetical protein